MTEVCHSGYTEFSEFALFVCTNDIQLTKQKILSNTNYATLSMYLADHQTAKFYQIMLKGDGNVEIKRI